MPDQLRHPYEAIDWIFQIERYVARIEETRGSRREALLPEEVEEIIELNILRAIEAAMDLAIRIGVDQRYDDPRKKYPYVRDDYRHLYFGSLADHGVIEAATAECLTHMAIWFFLAVREYWHLSNKYQVNDLDGWLAALRELVAAVVERFNLACPDGWGDSSGRDHFSGENSVVPIVASRDREDRGDVQVER